MSAECSCATLPETSTKTKVKTNNGFRKKVSTVALKWVQPETMEKQAVQTPKNFKQEEKLSAFKFSVSDPELCSQEQVTKNTCWQLFKNLLKIYLSSSPPSPLPLPLLPSLLPPSKFSQEIMSISPSQGEPCTSLLGFFFLPSFCGVMSIA